MAPGAVYTMSLFWPRSSKAHLWRHRTAPDGGMQVMQRHTAGHAEARRQPHYAYNDARSDSMCPRMSAGCSQAGSGVAAAQKAPEATAGRVGFASW